MASTLFKIEPVLINRIKKEQDIYNDNNEEQWQEAMGLAEFNDLSGMNFETKCESMSNICKAEVIDSFSTDYNSESSVKLEDSDQKSLLLSNNPSAISDQYLRPTDSYDYDEQKIDISEVGVGFAIKIEKQCEAIIGPSSVLDPQTGQKVLLKELTVPLVDLKYNFQHLNSETTFYGNGDLTTNLAWPISLKTSKTAIRKNNLSPTKKKSNNARGFGKQYDCITCLKSFAGKTQLHYHILSHHGDNHNLLGTIKSKTHDCPKCAKKFIRKYYLDSHIWSNHKDDENLLKMISTKTHHCVKCGKNFFFKSRLDCHIINYHNDDQQLLKMVSSTIYDCPKCSKPFVVKSDLKRHLKTVHNTGGNVLNPNSSRNYCPKCKKQFSQKTYLDGHIIASHSDDQHLLNMISCKTHTCPKCSKRFVQKARFDYHIIKDHSNDQKLLNMISSKIYDCLECSKKFTNKNDMTKHSTTH